MTTISARPVSTRRAARATSLVTILVTALAAFGASTAFAGPPADESAFLSENDAAMNQMMADMAVKPTGDVDKDFVAMMIPHHQGAIDMARAFLRYGSNEQLRRIAQEIIVDQQQEIAAMRLALGQPLPPSAPAPTAAAAAPPSPSAPPSASPAAPGHGMQHGKPMAHHE